MSATGNQERVTYTPAEAWTRAGLSRSAFYKALQKGRIPGSLRVGRRWLIGRAVFDQWLTGETAMDEPSGRTRSDLANRDGRSQT